MECANWPDVMLALGNGFLNLMTLGLVLWLRATVNHANGNG